MRKASGAFLISAAILLLYEFSAYGTHASLKARAEAEKSATSGDIPLPKEPHPLLIPLAGLGGRYPRDAGILAATLWCLGLGLFFLITERRVVPPPPPPSGIPGNDWAREAAESQKKSPMAAMFMLNSLFLVTFLYMAFVGAVIEGPIRIVAAFFLMVGLHVAGGLLLLILALFEKPKGLRSLGIAAPCYALGTAIAVATFILGKPTGAAP